MQIWSNEVEQYNISSSGQSQYCIFFALFFQKICMWKIYVHLLIYCGLAWWTKKFACLKYWNFRFLYFICTIYFKSRLFHIEFLKYIDLSLFRNKRFMPWWICLAKHFKTPYFWNKKTQNVFFFRFSLDQLWICNRYNKST